ncbi:hypothetical protein ALNOE001_15610 [Candidatus Methanobinarius endosymbioticus]|uniref:Big-1 domain-containing protein n=1 Tax=Candidatus Methanobinarius endosymbioticus TaxID=2006182 RepID=A0A366MA64_9EURY|nr:hypothetical protein ALNOE001_15610 [Candidatus Methanobinarius endosymbioticus]
MPLNTHIIIDSIGNISINDSIFINGYLLDENNNPVTNVTIDIIINSIVFTVSTNDNGKFSVLFSEKNTNGLVYVKTEFNGTKNYYGSFNSTIFNVDKIITSIIISNIVGKVGEEITISARLTDKNGNPIVDRTDLFCLGNINILIGS